MPADTLANLWPSIGVPNKEPEKPKPPEEQKPTIFLSLSDLLDIEEIKQLKRLLKPKVVTGPANRVFSNQAAAFTGTDKDQDMTDYNSVHVDVLVSGTTPSAVLTFYGVPFGPGDAVAFQLPDPKASQTITATTSFDLKCGAMALRAGLASVTGTSPRFTLILTPFNDAGPSNGAVEQQFGTIAYSTAQTATTIKTGAGFLHSVAILGGTAGAITVWDNTAGSGTTILPAFTPANVNLPVTILLDVAFSIGLTVTTGAATVIQFSYR